jgi:protein-glutamine gamma-glutamyltransferase
MRLARLHRRLAGLMSLAALGALAAGSGVTVWMGLVTAALVVALLRPPSDRIAALVDRGSKLIAVALFALVLYLALVAGGDVLEPGIAMLIVLMAGEVLRPLEVRNDFRLYSLSFGLVIAATAYYPGVAFGVAFVCYIVLATLTLMVGHLRRQAERFRIVDLRIGRSFLVVTAALSTITLLASLIIFVTFPRMPRSWASQGRAQSGTVAGFSDVISIGQHGGRLQANPRVMFRVEFDEGPEDPGGMYWRGLSFDHFDGTRWTRDRGWSQGPGRYLPPFRYGDRWGEERQEYRVFGGPPGVQVLFGQHPVLAVQPHSAIRPRLQRNGDLAYDGWDAPVYTVMSGPRLPSDSSLRMAGEGMPPEGDLYLQLPRLDARVAQLADSLTRGHPTRLDRTKAVERWLREEFRYSLDLPFSARETSIEHFLFTRRAGHCEYFSTGLVVLLRSAGIPARNVNGFLGGEWNERGGYLAVTGNNAHSWVEVWFPGLGWVPFDATPTADRDQMLDTAAASAVWPVLFWLDSVQFRWYRWVMAYDLNSQLQLLQALGDRFSPASSAGRSPAQIPWRTALTYLVGVLGVAGVVVLIARRRGERHSEESNLYLSLRRRYAAAGYPAPMADPPLAFLARLRASGAPGTADAEWIVARYLSARFNGEALDSGERAIMRARLAMVRQALRG